LVLPGAGPNIALGPDVCRIQLGVESCRVQGPEYLWVLPGAGLKIALGPAWCRTHVGVGSCQCSTQPHTHHDPTIRALPPNSSRPNNIGPQNQDSTALGPASHLP